MDTIPRDLLELPVSGANLEGPTFGNQLTGDDLHLIAFLRHFG